MPVVFAICCECKIGTVLNAAYLTYHHISFPVFLQDVLTITFNDYYVLLDIWSTRIYLTILKFGVPPMIGYFKCFNEDYMVGIYLLCTWLQSSWHILFHYSVLMTSARAGMQSCSFSVRKYFIIKSSSPFGSPSWALGLCSEIIWSQTAIWWENQDCN